MFNQGRRPRKLEIRGSLDDVKLAEEFLRAFFKHKNPSRGSDGLNPGVLKVWFVVGSRSLLARKTVVEIMSNKFQSNFKIILLKRLTQLRMPCPSIGPKLFWTIQKKTVQIVLIGSNTPTHFGQVQIRLFWTIFFYDI